MRQAEALAKVNHIRSLHARLDGVRSYIAACEAHADLDAALDEKTILMLCDLAEIALLLPSMAHWERGGVGL